MKIKYLNSKFFFLVMLVSIVGVLSLYLEKDNPDINKIIKSNYKNSVKNIIFIKYKIKLI